MLSNDKVLILENIVRDSASSFIKINYEEFKNRLGLNDIRFHWLLSDNVYIAGGAVLSWVYPEISSGDTDFFFTNISAALRFDEFIRGYEFKLTKNSRYTKTYNYKDQFDIQLVGINDPPIKSSFTKGIYGGRFFRMPIDTFKDFDFHASMFAVDCDYFYTRADAIESIISMDLTKNNKSHVNKNRFYKYVNKGFKPVKGVFYGDEGHQTWY